MGRRFKNSFSCVTVTPTGDWMTTSALYCSDDGMKLFTEMNGSSFSWRLREAMRNDDHIDRARESGLIS
jgi:hypothetical protein